MDLSLTILMLNDELAASLTLRHHTDHRSFLSKNQCLISGEETGLVILTDSATEPEIMFRLVNLRHC